MAYHVQVAGQGEPFKLTSVLKEAPPPGAEGTGWHCYIIAQGRNTITGHRQGSAKSVRLAAEEIVGHLNERRTGRRGRVQLIPTPRRSEWRS